MQRSIEVILVDIGNSAFKVTAVIDGKIKETERFSDFTAVADHIGAIPCIISSVRKVAEKDLNGLSYLLLNHKTSLPIKLDYLTPETLGPDRIAAAVGANSLFPGENNLVIDLGTCITMDLVTKEGVFKGGVISPGLTTRMRSMAHYTDRLPDISSDWKNIEVKSLGQSTKECLLSGSMMGIVYEIEGLAERIRQDFTSLNIIITGGDAEFFESKLKAHIFAGSKIVHEGLYRIWKYQ